MRFLQVPITVHIQIWLVFIVRSQWHKNIALESFRKHRSDEPIEALGKVCKMFVVITIKIIYSIFQGWAEIRTLNATHTWLWTGSKQKSIQFLSSTSSLDWGTSSCLRFHPVDI